MFFFFFVVVYMFFFFYFFFQAEVGIRDGTVTGVQTCALPIFTRPAAFRSGPPESPGWSSASVTKSPVRRSELPWPSEATIERSSAVILPVDELGAPPTRSEERRVGKERSSRWSPNHLQNSHRS